VIESSIFFSTQTIENFLKSVNLTNFSNTLEEFNFFWKKFANFLNKNIEKKILLIEIIKNHFKNHFDFFFIFFGEIQQGKKQRFSKIKEKC
jgi:hypothetical protein